MTPLQSRAKSKKNENDEIGLTAGDVEATKNELGIAASSVEVLAPTICMIAILFQRQWHLPLYFLYIYGGVSYLNGIFYSFNFIGFLFASFLLYLSLRILFVSLGIYR